MPVDRCILAQIVGDIQADILPFAQPDQRAGDTAIDGDARAASPFNNAMPAADGKIDDLAAELTKARRNARAVAAMAAAPVHAVPLRPSWRSGEG